MKNSIGKTELVKQVTEKVGKVSQLGKIIDAIFDVIADNLVKDNEVSIINFGTFKVIDKAERKGRNPRTGEEITIPACKSPAFKPSKVLKLVVNNA